MSWSFPLKIKGDHMGTTVTNFHLNAEKVCVALTVLTGLGCFAVANAQSVDLEVVHRIKNEAFQRSHVMEYVRQISDRNGSRLSASPGYVSAARSVLAAMHEAGVDDANIVPWGTFGRSWSYQGVEVRMVQPFERPLFGVPMAWSRGTRGVVTGDAILAPLFDRADDPDTNDLEKVALQIADYARRYKGQLRGKVVLIAPIEPRNTDDITVEQRLEREALDELMVAEEPGPMSPIAWPIWRFPDDPEENDRLWRNMPIEVDADYWERELAVYSRLYQFLADEGVAGVLMVDDRGPAGTIFADNYGSMHPDSAIPPATVILGAQDYNQVVRFVEHGDKVSIELRVDAKFHSENEEGRNVIANIPGKSKRDEIVMLGGHLDSWHAGTGATDNAAGCAIAMEAMRILAGLNLPLKRTVRLALWDGEEQNYYGSRAYVARHFANPVTMELKPEHGRLSAYFNIDGGGGKIRGVFLQSNDMVRPLFEAWLAPFEDLGVSTISIRGSYGSDHLVFDSVGLPAFHFLQDPLDYDSLTHHSALDTAHFLNEGDLMQAAAVVAAVVYHAANSGALLPRKRLPNPLPAKQSIPPILEYTTLAPDLARSPSLPVAAPDRIRFPGGNSM